MDDNKLEGATDTPEGKAAIETDLNRPRNVSNETPTSSMKLKAKPNPDVGQPHGTEESWDCLAGKQLCRKRPGVPVNK